MADEDATVILDGADAGDDAFVAVCVLFVFLSGRDDDDDAFAVDGVIGLALFLESVLVLVLEPKPFAEAPVEKEGRWPRSAVDAFADSGAGIFTAPFPLLFIIIVDKGDKAGADIENDVAVDDPLDNGCWPLPTIPSLCCLDLTLELMDDTGL